MSRGVIPHKPDINFLADYFCGGKEQLDALLAGLVKHEITTGVIYRES
jgi:hypothetical protein